MLCVICIDISLMVRTCRNKASVGLLEIEWMIGGIGTDWVSISMQFTSVLMVFNIPCFTLPKTYQKLNVHTIFRIFSKGHSRSSFPSILAMHVNHIATSPHVIRKVRTRSKHK